MRRDFTVNALAQNVATGEIVDYVGGLDDLKLKKLRILHDESFIDDPTRIIRGLKFRVRFGFDLDEHTRQLQEDYLANINYDMSYKRVKKELIETFNLNSNLAFKIFVNEGIYKLLSPEKFDLPEADVESLVTKYNPNNVWLVYLGLLPDLSRLEFTKEEKKILDDFYSIGNLNNDFEIYKAFENKSIESILLYGIAKNLNAATRYLDILRKIKILITGKDLLQLGITPSAEYQRIFDYVLSEKLKNSNLTFDDEIRLVKNLQKIV